MELKGISMKKDINVRKSGSELGFKPLYTTEINKEQNNSEALNCIGFDSLKKYLAREVDQSDMKQISVYGGFSFLHSFYEVWHSEVFVLKIIVKNSSFNDFI